MIELYDAERLLTRRDRSLAVMAALLLLSSAAVASYAHLQQGRLQQVNTELQELQQRVAHSNSSSGTKPSALLADLQRQAEQLEREAALDGTSGAQPGSTPDEERDALQQLRASQWLQRLGLLAQSDISLQKVEVDRQGELRLEGVASHAEAVTRFVQNWERQDDLARVQPRSIEVKQDRSAAGQPLRFALRASPVAVRP